MSCRWGRKLLPRVGGGVEQPGNAERAPAIKPAVPKVRRVLLSARARYGLMQGTDGHFSS